MTIADWPAAERPRERLLALGPAALSDAELIALFLRTGVPGKSALDLARELLARRCPLLVAPAMNVEMWENAATQRNVLALRDDGIAIAGPAPGDQACGEVGMGRMLEAGELLAEIESFFQPKALAGRRVLITAGPTEEPIDPVRMLTNASSGKMGFAVARACREAGAEVLLVSGPVALSTPAGVARTDVRTAAEMFESVKSSVQACDIFFSVAAVADYRVANRSEQKIKKNGGRGMTLDLVENPDILAWVAGRKNAPFCVGFAAESENLGAHAKDKRARKGVPLLAANLAHEALGADDSSLTLFDDRGEHPLGRGPKIDLARKLVAHVAALMAGTKR